MKNTQQKLYAIWANDRFPNVLGGEVIEVKPQGFCTVKGYDGMKFKYLQLLPLNDGITVMNKVNLLSQEYHEATKKLFEQKYAAVKTLLKAQGVEIK